MKRLLSILLCLMLFSTVAFATEPLMPDYGILENFSLPVDASATPGSSAPVDVSTPDSSQPELVPPEQKEQPETPETPPPISSGADAVTPDTSNAVPPDASSTVQPDVPDIAPPDLSGLSADVAAIRSDLHALVYFIVPFGAAVLLLWAGFRWFSRTFIHF